LHCIALHSTAPQNQAAAGNLLVIFLVIEAVLFGLFTCCMMLDQYTVVSTNTTSIDRLKGEYHGLNHDVNEVFGGKDGRFRLDWFLPVPAAFPSSLASDILGYRLDDADAGARDRDEEEGILMVDRRRSLDRGGDAAVAMAAGGGGLASGGAVGVSSSVVSRERGRGGGDLGVSSRHSPGRGPEEEPVEISINPDRATLLRPVTTV
jgi:hypothetical protein